jgi:glutamate 5-kinase
MYQRIVVKIGSNVITQTNGLPDINRIQHLTAQIAEIKKQGIEVILVTSGAVASGRSMIKLNQKYDAVATRQLFAAIGQVKLINTYSDFFLQHQLSCAQVLVTKEDFRDRVHYLNMRNCIEILLQNNVIPVVNENDVVSVTELMFTDNDELAGLIASMVDADALFILSNVDGIFDGDPKLPGSQVIEKITEKSASISAAITSGKSEFGRGGMLTKYSIASKVAKLGIHVHIANGKKDQVLTLVLNQMLKHSHFIANKHQSGKKKWIAHAENAATGAVFLNEGACKALLSDKASSLLPIGIVKVEGNFQKGDIIKIFDENKQLIGLGIAQYHSDKAIERTGQKKQKPLVHYDYFYASN